MAVIIEPKRTYDCTSTMLCSSLVMKLHQHGKDWTKSDIDIVTRLLRTTNVCGVFFASSYVTVRNVEIYESIATRPRDDHSVISGRDYHCETRKHKGNEPLMTISITQDHCRPSSRVVNIVL